MTITIRRAIREDAERIAEMEKQIFPDPWSLASVEYEICSNPRGMYLVAEVGGLVVGYIGFWVVPIDEFEIANVAVDPACRRQGIGEAMLKHMVKLAEENGITGISLEVRPSNEPAIALYTKYGFKAEGRRKGYYSDGEDAIIMWRR